jgi:hypothetical protein
MGIISLSSFGVGEHKRNVKHFSIVIHPYMNTVPRVLHGVYLYTISDSSRGVQYSTLSETSFFPLF